MFFVRKKKLENFEKELSAWADLLEKKETYLNELKQELDSKIERLNDIQKAYPNILAYKKERESFYKEKNEFENLYKTKKARDLYLKDFNIFQEYKQKIENAVNFACYVFGLDFKRISDEGKLDFINERCAEILKFSEEIQFHELQKSDKKSKYGLLEYFNYFIPKSKIKKDDKTGYVYIGLFTNDKEHKNGIKIGGTKNSDFTKRESRTINPHYKIIYVSKKLDDWKRAENQIHEKYKKFNLKNKNSCREWFSYKILDDVLLESEYQFKKLQNNN